MGFPLDHEMIVGVMMSFALNHILPTSPCWIFDAMHLLHHVINQDVEEVHPDGD